MAVSASFKVRLEDGVEVGPLDVEMLRSWWQQGMVKADTQVRQVKPIQSKRWLRLSDAIDISDWGGAGGSRARRRSESAADDEEETADGPERWRVYTACALLLSMAAGAFYLAFSRTPLVPSFEGAPWREIALGFLALALLLVRGWELARKAARVLVCVLTFAPFALAAPIIVRGLHNGVPVAPLLALFAVWVMLSGLFFLLAGRSLPPESSAFCLLWIVLGAAAAVNFGLASRPLLPGLQ